jgi:hypothetical protein
MRGGKDCRGETLLDRKQELRRLLSGVAADARIQYVDYVDGAGIPLFEQICKLDLEGIPSTNTHPMSVTERPALGSKSDELVRRLWVLHRLKSQYAYRYQNASGLLFARPKPVAQI